MATPTFSGRLLLRGSADYERARLSAVWNARKPDRHPEAILLAAADDDVVAGVRWAAERGWRVGIRSGGHSWIGTGVRDGSLLIDLSGLDEMTIDRAAGTATVRPAVRGVDFNAALADAGLVFPSGHCPSVGLGGFLLGGGYGWNSRALGPACMSVEAADVVLADGTLVHADDETHPEIMWALRGAGPGFFGVVTRFRLRVHPAYHAIVRSAYSFPNAMRDEVLAWTYDTVPDISPWLEMSAKVTQEVTTITAAAFCRAPGDESMLAAVEAAPFLRHAVRRVERRPSTINDLYALSDALTPHGNRYAVDGVWTSAPVGEVLAAGRGVLDAIPTPESFLLWMLWDNYPEAATACWSTQGRLYFSPNAVWTDPAADLRAESWAHAALDDLAGVAAGTQFADHNPADRPDHGIEPAQQQRLAALRAKYDPSGLLCDYLRPEESTTALGRQLSQR
ncbi:FAD-binding oxidoreductase [Actinoplanes sp. NPDC026619]|uniref:FAD-binding oxidoreductase n=1 Tax=Actinoplanes sp. NPDC026619 TaxID=3155798 RepID=UPI0033C11AB5